MSGPEPLLPVFHFFYDDFFIALVPKVTDRTAAAIYSPTLYWILDSVLTLILGQILKRRSAIILRRREYLYQKSIVK
jgi:hypothetical protein